MIIGLTGTICAGKGVFAEMLKEQGFVYLSLSEELRDFLKERKIEINRKNLQDWGNKFRQEHGASFLAEIIKNKINNQKYTHAIVDGIRNPGEVESLRKLPGFFLVSIDAPREERFKRIIERNRESAPKTWEEFLVEDKRDQAEDNENGQRVRECMDMADFYVINSGTLEELKNKLNEVYEKIELRTPRPTWDEYFLEIARVVGRRATCNRGRAGTVVAKDKQILVTGYAGSPKGLPHCDEIGHQMKEVIHNNGTVSKHCTRTTHSEQNAICQAAKIGTSINGGTLYTKMTPCATCAKMIINAGISRIVCEKKYHQGAESEELFRKAGIPIEFIKDSVEEYKNQ